MMLLHDDDDICPFDLFVIKRILCIMVCACRTDFYIGPYRKYLFGGRASQLVLTTDKKKPLHTRYRTKRPSLRQRIIQHIKMRALFDDDVQRAADPGQFPSAGIRNHFDPQMGSSPVHGAEMLEGEAAFLAT